MAICSRLDMHMSPSALVEPLLFQPSDSNSPERCQPLDAVRDPLRKGLNLSFAKVWFAMVCPCRYEAPAFASCWSGKTTNERDIPSAAKDRRSQQPVTQYTTETHSGSCGLQEAFQNATFNGSALNVSGKAMRWRQMTTRMLAMTENECQYSRRSPARCGNTAADRKATRSPPSALNASGKRNWLRSVAHSKLRSNQTMLAMTIHCGQSEHVGRLVSLEST